jgi:hypothetical protein
MRAFSFTLHAGSWLHTPFVLLRFRLLDQAREEYVVTCGAWIQLVKSQAGGDTIGVRDVIAAEPEYIGLACFLLFRRALVLGQRSVLTHDRQRDRNRQAQTNLTCVHHFSMSVACD